MKKTILISLLLAAGFVACSGGRAPEEAAPPPPILGGPPNMETVLNFSQRLENVNSGCEDGNFRSCELSCELLQNSAVPEAQVPNLACRCFFTEFARWLESEPTKQVQQRLCNGFTTVEKLFGENGLFPTALARREGGEPVGDLNAEEAFPCLPILDLSNPKKNLLKILVNLKTNNSDLDQTKPFLNEAVNGLKAILPTLEKAMETNAQCTIPGRLFGNTEENIELKSGDLFYLAGKSKLYGAFAQTLGAYEFNLNPNKILAENLRVRDFAGDPRNPGAVRSLGTQFIHQFLVADAGKVARIFTAETHEGETIVRAPLRRKIDDKPLGVFPEGANLLPLKNDFQSALDNLLESSQRERTEFLGNPIPENQLEGYRKMKTSLDTNQSIEMEHRLFANFHRFLESPPNIASVTRRDFENNPLINDPRSISINLLKLKRETRTWDRQFFCKNNETGVSTELVGINSCVEAATSCPPTDNTCGEQLTTTEAELAELNAEALLAAAKDSFQYNFEPQFGRIRDSICRGRSLQINVTDREGDQIILVPSRLESWPNGIAVEILGPGAVGFRIVTPNDMEPGTYDIYLGISDGHGAPLIEENPSLPEGEQAPFIMNSLPEVIKKVKLSVTDCS